LSAIAPSACPPTTTTSPSTTADFAGGLATASLMVVLTLSALRALRAVALVALAGRHPAVGVLAPIGSQGAADITLAADRPELVKAMAMIAAGGKAPMKPGAPEALLGCFRLDRPDAERLANMKLAFFAPGNDPSVWRDGWYPEVAKAQIAATRATPVDGWWNAGSSTPPAGDPGTAGHRGPAGERPDDEG
jgi:hypothetical protein